MSGRKKKRPYEALLHLIYMIGSFSESDEWVSFKILIKVSLG